MALICKDLQNMHFPLYTYKCCIQLWLLNMDIHLIWMDIIIYCTLLNELINLFQAKLDKCFCCAINVLLNCHYPIEERERERDILWETVKWWWLLLLLLKSASKEKTFSSIYPSSFLHDSCPSHDPWLKLEWFIAFPVYKYYIHIFFVSIHTE